MSLVTSSKVYKLNNGKSVTKIINPFRDLRVHVF